MAVFLTACGSFASPRPSAQETPAGKPFPTAADISATPSPTESVESLIAILEASDPEARAYDPQSAAYTQFPETLNQLSAMGSGAVDAASYMAHAISFPRPDSYLAAQALTELGPDITATTIGILVDNFQDPRAEARLVSVILLSTIGSRAACAVDRVAPLLWDSDAYVRSAAASTLESLTGEDLVQTTSAATEVPLSFNSIPADTPEGILVANARRWWTEQGSQVNWHPSYGICDP